MREAAALAEAAVTHEEYGAALLSRALADSRQRNLSRPPNDGRALFDEKRILSSAREALSFLVANLACIETASPPNLGSCVPLPAISACFTAQIEDEIVHGALLARWLELSGAERMPPSATVFSIKAALLVQHDPWLGIGSVEILTEHYASALLDEVVARVDAPYLRVILVHIKVDEERHKAVAVVSVGALRAAGVHQGFLVRVFGPVVTHVAQRYVRHVFGQHLQRSGAARAVPHVEILERALDEVRDAHARA